MSFQITADSKPANALLVPFVQRILTVYARCDKDPSKALKQADIDSGIATRAVPISMAQLLELGRHAMRDLNDEALGWFSRPMPWGSFGLLARASLTAPDIRTALRRLFLHLGVVIPDISTGLEEAGKIATITLNENRKSWDSALSHELALVVTLHSVLEYSCWLADSAIPIIEARLPFETPFQESYAILFDGRLHVGDGPASFSFDNRYLDLPNRRNDADMQNLLHHEARYIATYRYQKDRLLVSRVRDLMSEPDGLAAVSADSVADALHISTRTLCRHLKEEGTSLRTLKDETRKAVAIRLLSQTTRPIKHIAQMVGFNHEQNFIRAFRQWTGESPSRFRQRSGNIQALDSDGQK